MASCIDTKMKLLDAAGLDEVEIIAAMADYMSDFRHLITNMTGPAMNTLCREFAGLHRYARIVETIASGIAAGKIKIPGGRTVSDEQKIAAAIDQRVRQLEATGIDDAALLERMVGHLFDLHRLWNTASDESLALLCREYPGLYRYGLLVEQASEAQRKMAHIASSHPPELPDAIKGTVARLLRTGPPLNAASRRSLTRARSATCGWRPTYWKKPVSDGRRCLPNCPVNCMLQGCPRSRARC